MAALPVAEEFGMLLVSPTVTTDLLSGKDDAFVRVVSPASQYARRSAEYQLTNPRLRRLAAIHDTANLSYTESWLSAFRTRFEAGGGKVIVAAGFSAAPANALRELVARTLAENPDGLLLLANSVDAALIAQFARAERPGLQIVLSEWPATERFVELAGAAAEGVVATQFYDAGSAAPAYREFHEAYRMRYGADPGFAAITGHDAAMLALTALAKSIDKPKPHLVGVRDFPGLQGLIAIDRYGDAQRRNYVIRVDGGRFVALE
jgi:branched-chain amino acid transport system substrate-binding protein